VTRLEDEDVARQRRWGTLLGRLGCLLALFLASGGLVGGVFLLGKLFRRLSSP
jgi:hypothetical protein